MQAINPSISLKFMENMPQKYKVRPHIVSQKKKDTRLKAKHGKNAKKK